MAEMTPIERVVAALTFKTPDRVPVVLYFQSAVQHDLKELDYTWEEALNHPRKLFQAIEREYTYWGADNFFLPVDFRVEGEALGSKVTYKLKCGEGFRMGVVTEWAVNDKSDLDKLTIPDPTKDKRMSITLEVIRRLAKKYPQVPIVGFVNGPPDTASDVFVGRYPGIFVEMVNDPEWVLRLFDKCAETSIAFAKAMIEAGAVAIATVEGGMIDEAVSPEQYLKFVAPGHKKIREAIGVPYVYHQCENATPFFDIIVNEIQPACVAFHDSVDLKWAKEKYGGKVGLAGNVSVSKAGAALMDGTPEDVLKEAKQCIEIGMPGSGFALSAGCEVHHACKPENIKALVQAAKDYGVYK
jgi:MtaA/CmuA family methyltransferase